MESQIPIDPSLGGMQHSTQPFGGGYSVVVDGGDFITTGANNVVNIKAHDELNGPIVISEWAQNIWSQIMEQLNAGNSYAFLVLTNFLKTISAHESNWLLQRYESIIGMPGTCRQDFSHNLAVYHPAGDIPAYEVDSILSPVSDISLEENSNTMPVKKPATSNNARKAKSNVDKVPRPPNAFILYRRDFHYLTKEQNPGLHNNVISQIIGKQWAGESDELKGHYTRLAKEAKEKHATLHPEYQYKPRRPCEKKRRLTKNKKRQIMEQIMAQSGVTTQQANALFDPQALSGGWSGVRETMLPAYIQDPISNVSTLIGYHNEAVAQGEYVLNAGMDSSISKEFVNSHFDEMSTINKDALETQVNNHAAGAGNLWGLPEHKPGNEVIPGGYLLGP